MLFANDVPISLRQDTQTQRATDASSAEIPLVSAEKYPQLPIFDNDASGLDAQDMAWLANVLFDPDIDIDQPMTG